MPAYGTPQGGGVLTCVNAGDQFTLFNAETLTAPQASISFNRGSDPVAGQPNGIVFQISFATAPTAAVQIQGSNDLVNWSVVYTSTNTSPDSYPDLGQFAFYRAFLVSQSAGGALTVIAQR
jgi:hypothetical protein